MPALLEKAGIKAFLRWSRAGEWWEYKLLPCLTAGYATSLHLGATPVQALAAFAFLLLALVPGGIFVSLINDLSDRQDDARAGKTNRQAGTRRRLPILLSVACMAAGAGVVWSFRDSPALLATYAAGWGVYMLYSLPPFRLKTKGMLGALCDATGANVVPALLASLIIARALGAPPDVRWLGPIAIWSLAFGMRGILWHQIGDLAADLRSETKTLVVRWGETKSMIFARRFLFPIELAALALWIVQIGFFGIGASTIVLAAYLWLVHERLDRLEMCFTLVKPRPRSFILMHEFYDVFLPIGFLLAGAVGDWRNLALLCAHLILFPIRWRQVSDDFLSLRDPRYLRRK